MGLKRAYEPAQLLHQGVKKNGGCPAKIASATLLFALNAPSLVSNKLYVLPVLAIANPDRRNDRGNRT